MSKLMPAEQKIKDLLHKVEILRIKIVSGIKRKIITCKECGKTSRISDWVFLQAHYYISPHSCTGGDRWLPSNDNLCFIECPKCGKSNYIYTHPQKAKILGAIEQAAKHSSKSIFKSVKDFYKD